MRGAMVFLLLAIGLFVFGCACPTPPENAQEATYQPNGSAQPAVGGDDVSGINETETGAEGATDSESEDTGASTSTDYTGQAFASLVGLGVPLQCDIKTADAGMATTMKLYMKGEGEWRGETTVESDGCSKFVWIKKGNDFYMGCADGAMFGDCAWLKMQSDTSGASSSGSGSVLETPDLDSVPPADIDCLPWAYDASKFAVSGKICTMDDLYGGYPSGYE